MLASGDLAHLKRALLSNSAVLFTGAGFSRDATNVSDRSIPTSDEFADQLWKYLGYPGKRVNTSLPRLFEAALKQKHEPLRDLQVFYSLFEPVHVPDKKPLARKSFLLGKR